MPETVGAVCVGTEDYGVKQCRLYRGGCGMPFDPAFARPEVRKG